MPQAFYGSEKPERHGQNRRAERHHQILARDTKTYFWNKGPGGPNSALLAERAKSRIDKKDFIGAEAILREILTFEPTHITTVSF
ncbi:MAG: hypothetical protein V1909_05785, partial [Candidatus Micrarchaeota archaeon]